MTDVQVDPSLCLGHGRCNAYGSDVYGRDDSGYCHIGNAACLRLLSSRHAMGRRRVPSARSRYPKDCFHF